MRVEFDDFSAGAGKVWVHDGSHVAGPYTGRGLFDDGHFWSGAVFSGSVIVEYEPAPGAPEELQPPFTIRAISHQARTAAETAAAAAKDPADFCELDANCYPDWKGSVSSVAQISFMDNGDELFCSGSLLATRDNSFKPYFLTAGHCINNEAAARTVEAYWTYQTPACGGTPPASRTHQREIHRGRAPDFERRLGRWRFQPGPAAGRTGGYDLRRMGHCGPAGAYRADRHSPPFGLLEAHFVRRAHGRRHQRSAGRGRAGATFSCR